MFIKIQETFSQARLKSFHQTGASDAEMVARCLWNAQLCEAFYPSLQLLEVALRNRIHTALTFCNRTPLWFKGSYMSSMELEDVAAAEKEIEERGFDATDPNRIVAVLRFGFWTRLFGKHYQQPLWNNRTFLLKAFPNANNIQRTRPQLSARVDNIRRFRNKVFHHERILGLNIDQYHTDIVELLDWLEPSLLTIHGMMDRFPEIHRQSHCDKMGIIYLANPNDRERMK